MKNYYYNQKTQDLLIFDTEGNEILVLERLTGIRVFTSSELHDPAQVSHDQNFNQEAPIKEYKKQLSRANQRRCGKCGKPGHRSDNCGKFVSEIPAPGKKSTRAARKLVCKNCGKEGHFTKTCKNEPKLPDAEVESIVSEERATEPLT